MSELPWPQVGMRARWMGAHLRPRIGNPPALGAAFVIHTARTERTAPLGWHDCDIIEIAVHQDGQRAIVARLRTADGLEFDPRIDPARVVPLVSVEDDHGR